MRFNYFFVKGFYSPEEVTKLKNILIKNQDPNQPDVPAKNVVKTAKVGIVPILALQDHVGGILNLIKKVNKENFGFDLYDFTEYDTVNFNQYDSSEQGEYGWHTDFPLSLFHQLKLTILVNLSTEPYEGGDFEIFLNGPIPVPDFKEPGGVLIFPSYISHRVTPVTKGSRASMALFASGPRLR